MASHQAAVLMTKGGPFICGPRATSEPGPNEVLVEVKAVALNPVDYAQRDFGFPPVPVYPAVVGSDTAGVVTKIGSAVKTCPPVGSRVIAFASAFYQNGTLGPGAFQELTLAQSEGAIPLPDHLSFEQGATLPLAALSACTAWTTIGIPLTTRFTPADKQAVLIWGASSSVGTLAVQSAKTLGFTIYATASPKHHGYIKKLGADAVFDYKSPDVVAQIVAAVKKDGVTLTTAHAVVIGALQPVLDVLKETKGSSLAKVAHSPPLPEDHPTLDDTKILFNLPSMDTATRNKHFHDVFHGWLDDGLKSGSIVPSPPVKVAAHGLEGINTGLDTLKAGVSCVKVVVSI